MHPFPSLGTCEACEESQKESGEKSLGPHPFVPLVAAGAQVVVQLLRLSDSATPWPSLSFTISWSLLKLKSIESVMPSNHLVLCHPILLPSVFPSIKVFSNESALRIRWSKYWSFSISSFNEYSGLIFFRIDWFDLTVQGTLKSQHHNSRVSILICAQVISF